MDQCLLKRFCLEEMGVEYEGILYYTTLHWLSRGQVLGQSFTVLGEKKSPALRPVWQGAVNLLPHLVGIFGLMDELNFFIQDFAVTLSILLKNLGPHLTKLSVWKNRLDVDNCELPTAGGSVSEGCRQEWQSLVSFSAGRNVQTAGETAECFWRLLLRRQP